MAERHLSRVAHSPLAIPPIIHLLQGLARELLSALSQINGWWKISKMSMTDCLKAWVQRVERSLVLLQRERWSSQNSKTRYWEKYGPSQTLIVMGSWTKMNLRWRCT